MAVFICAADESADENPKGHFFYGGFAAPVEDWEGAFASAWNERVLSGPPKIPYVHMTDMRSPAWRSQYGLSEIEADNRLDEASRVIGSMGSLIPVVLSVEESEFNAILRLDFAPKPNKRESLEPDYICFLCFAVAQLQWIHDARKDVHKVDFWVERSSKKITKYIADFHDRLPDALQYIGSGHLVPLVGEMQAVGKDRIPAQAADMLAWHARNLANGTLDQLGQKRYWRMTDGGDGRGRYGYRGGLNSDLLRNLAEALSKT